MAEIICDGIHIHPSVIRNAFRMFGNDRMILISDAMRATGMEDGEYELGGQPVIKKGRLATLKDGTIAGSATNLFDCMKNAVQFGIPLGVAVKAATCNPAKSIGTWRHPARADSLLSAPLSFPGRGMDLPCGCPRCGHIRQHPAHR